MFTRGNQLFRNVWAMIQRVPKPIVNFDPCTQNHAFMEAICLNDVRIIDNYLLQNRGTSCVYDTWKTAMDEVDENEPMMSLLLELGAKRDIPRFALSRQISNLGMDRDEIYADRIFQIEYGHRQRPNIGLHDSHAAPTGRFRDHL